MTIIILTLTFCVYSLFEGYREALYYYFRNKYVVQKDLHEHLLFTFQRIMMLLCLFCSMGLYVLWLPFLFTFLHDGAYYTQRNRIDGSYPETFFAQSTTSTAVWDKLKLGTPVLRIILFFIGILGLTITYKYGK